MSEGVNKAAVYAIKNLVNQRLYVGSSKDWQKRIKHHIGLLRNGKHPNFKLQRAWEKYGENAFQAEVLEAFAETEESTLLDIEQKWINFYQSHHKGYNISGLAQGGEREGAGRTRTGKKHRVNISLDINDYGWLTSEAQKRGISISSTAQAIIREARGEKKPNPQKVKFWIGGDPLRVDALIDPHNLVDVAAYIYGEWEGWNGFEVSQTKKGDGFNITMKALPETWERATRDYEVFCSNI